MRYSPNRVFLLIVALFIFIMIAGCSTGGTPVAPIDRQPAEDNSGGLNGMAGQLGSGAGTLSEYWESSINIDGVEWQADLSPDGGIHRALGKGIALKGSIKDFINSHADIFRVNADNLWLLSDETHDGIRYVIYRQAFNGIPILETSIDLRFGRGGKLVMLGSDVFPGITGITPVNLSRGSAESIAVSYHEGEVSESNLYIAPLVDGTFVPVWRTIVGDWLMLISATDGNVIQEEELVWDGDFDGQVDGIVNYVDPDDGSYRDGLPDTRVRFTLGTDYDIWTNETGAYHYTTDLYSEITTNVRILGKWINVNNKWHDDADITVTTYADTPADFLFDENTSDETEANVYYWASSAHNYVKNIDPAFTGIDSILTANVNQSPWCNAMANNSSINFYRAASGCINLGEIADVIIHEYGHVVTYRQYNSTSIPPTSLHEGFSDYFANTITDQPLIGLGYSGPGTYFRNSDNELYWPDNDCGGEGHCLGEYLAGALWDLRQALGSETSDHLWWFARYGKPTTFPDFATEVCIADDDNDNLDDGTPNYLQIWTAFEEIHGIPVPDAPDYINLTLEVTPDVDPIEISRSTGGSFGFNLHVINNLPWQASVEAWVAVKRPNGMWYGPMIPPSHYLGTPVNLTFKPDANFNYHIIQNIPAGLPLGAVFEYNVDLGDYIDLVSDDIKATDKFTFEIVP